MRFYTPAIVALLAVNPLTSANEESGKKEIIGSHPTVDVFSIEGDRHIHLDLGEGMMPYGTMTSMPVDGREGLYCMESDIFGTGVLQVSHDLSHIDVTLTNGIQFAMDWDVDAGGHGFRLQGVEGFIFPIAQLCDPIADYPFALLDVMKIPNDNDHQGFRFQLKRGLHFDIDVDWIQFLKLTITFGGVDANGNPWSDTNPDGDKWPVTGNGGAAGHNEQTGEGYVDGDGDTTYVDSGADGQSEWDHAGTGGDNGHANWMDDKLGTPGNKATFGRNAGFIARREARNGRRVSWVKFRYDFTAYCIINGTVVWKIEWHWEFKADANGVSSTGAIDSSEAASDMSDAHKAAKDNFENGGFDGAPCK